MVKMYYKWKYIGHLHIKGEGISFVVVVSVNLGEKLINKWNNSLPKHWVYESLDFVPYRPRKNERVIYNVHEDS